MTLLDLAARPSRLPDDFFARMADPAVAQDPHVVLDALRGNQPARLRNGDLVVLGHTDVVDVLRSPDFAKPPMPAAPIAAVRTLSRMFLMLNAPDHPRLRRAAAPLFTPAAVAARAEQVRNAVDELLADRDQLEIVSDLAYPLPLNLMCDWLGAPASTRTDINRWGTTLTAALDAPLPTGLRGAPRLIGALVRREFRPLETLSAARDIVNYARSIIRSEQADGEILDVLRRAIAHEVMSEDEAVATWVLLIIAGHETTANLIANATYLLLSNPQEITDASEDTLRTALNEALRLESPVPLAVRVATRETTVGHHRVARGRLVYPVLAAANRDPSVFDDPHTFRVDRDASSHVAFGYGSHFCLGAQLARLEAVTAIRQLLQRHPTLNNPTPQWRPSFATRGLERLHVTLPTQTR